MPPPPPSPSEPAGRLVLPPRSLVLLVGVSGSGKSTFAARHFAPTQVLSSDAMRAMVADDPNDQAATDAAFELLHTALSLRLARGRLTVVDATNVEGWARGRLLAVARRHQRPSCAIVLAPPLEACLARNLSRARPTPAAGGDPPPAGLAPRVAADAPRRGVRAGVGPLDGRGDRGHRRGDRLAAVVEASATWRA